MKITGSFLDIGFYNVSKYVEELSNRSGRVGCGGMIKNKLILFREACL